MLTIFVAALLAAPTQAEVDQPDRSIDGYQTCLIANVRTLAARDKNLNAERAVSAASPACEPQAAKLVAMAKAGPGARAALGPAAAQSTAKVTPDPGRETTARGIRPSELVEIEEENYSSCLQSAARHYGALAGRAGPGALPSGDPYADCRSARQAWEKALVALDPAGGLVAAQKHIDRKFKDIAARTSATWQQAYNDNNYQ